MPHRKFQGSPENAALDSVGLILIETFGGLFPSKPEMLLYGLIPGPRHERLDELGLL